ncbi:SH3 domain-containing protein [Kribbella monticola]|uniref:SH3 domain-containing protein n=1 Tax=Kribbella monticola TaxID=2185285 RepID=UPI000DD3DB58|nr:SH3 domain-containing protein [Kribbella monticola]
MKTKLLRILPVAALGLAAATMTGGVAQAAVPTADTVVASPDTVQSCHINQNNVNYRSGPGTQYPSYGQVHAGQPFDGRMSTSGGWILGNLPGIRNNVWILGDYVTC